eukprot:SAG31_NODE_20328_length_577_cov_1.393305_1_plen_96_part_10
MKRCFDKLGYVIVDDACSGSADADVFGGSFLSAEQCVHLKERLDCVLAGRFDTGAAPARLPPFERRSIAQRSRHTVQIIDIAKADHAFQSLVRSPQ